jgi:hypothetical protein
MNDADESELRRLCNELGQVDRQPSLTGAQREALKKAALALGIVFGNGLRHTLEEQYHSLGQPLTIEQRNHLKSIGIDPDAH